jgi:hypothetical protein
VPKADILRCGKSVVIRSPRRRWRAAIGGMVRPSVLGSTRSFERRQQAPATTVALAQSSLARDGGRGNVGCKSRVCAALWLGIVEWGPRPRMMNSEGGLGATASALYRSRQNAPKPKKRDFHQHASHASPVSFESWRSCKAENREISSTLAQSARASRVRALRACSQQHLSLQQHGSTQKS